MLFTTLALIAPSHAADGDIVALAEGNEDFSTLVRALKAADLVETLQGEGPFTVFAPDNAAFEALPEGSLDHLLAEDNKEKLTRVLTYHVVPGKIMAADVKPGEAPTIQGDALTLSVDGDIVRVDTARITHTDLVATNGVVHVIDSVIMPEEKEEEPPVPKRNAVVDVAAETGGFQTLLQAVDAAGLTDTLVGEGPYTVFAPTDEAFAELGDDDLKELLEPEKRERLTEILTYHVIPGKLAAADLKNGKLQTVEGSALKVKLKKGKVMLDGKTEVVATDVMADNGVIHAIDHVLKP